MIFLCLAIAAIAALSVVALTEQAEGAALPDSLQISVWKLEAVGKRPAADSLKRVFKAKLQLEQRQKAAQAELVKKQEEARRKLQAQWVRKSLPCRSTRCGSGPARTKPRSASWLAATTVLWTSRSCLRFRSLT